MSNCARRDGGSHLGAVEPARGSVEHGDAAANQLRLHFASLAYVLAEALRRSDLAGTEREEAQADTIRLKLLKIAAKVRITSRRIWVRYSCAYPWQNTLLQPGPRCAAE